MSVPALSVIMYRAVTFSVDAAGDPFDVFRGTVSSPVPAGAWCHLVRLQTDVATEADPEED